MPSRKQPTPAPRAAEPVPPPAAEQASQEQPPAPAAESPAAPQAPVVLRLFCEFTDLGHARALPEAPAGDTLTLGAVEFEPGTIEQFADEDGRTMRIVNVGGTAHKYPAPEVPAAIEEA